MLLILKEIYGSMGIQTDAQLPQQTLSIERVSTPSISASPSNVTSPIAAPMYVGMDPTAPVSAKPVGPPPTVGFVRKSWSEIKMHYPSLWGYPWNNKRREEIDEMNIGIMRINSYFVKANTQMTAE